MRVDKLFANVALGIMGLFLFISILLVFVFPVLTTMFTSFTGVLLPENYYLANEPNSGWFILFIDTLVIIAVTYLKGR